MSIKPGLPKGQPEIQLAQYASIKRPSTDHRESEIRFRLVKRRSPSGNIKIYFDIREYVLDEKKAMFTRKGITFSEDEIELVINNLLRARAELSYGSHPRN